MRNLASAWLACVLAGACRAPVEGLQRTERARACSAPEASAGTAEFAFGRVLDAASSAPLEGALVEVWTENWNAPAVLVDRAISARDGTYVVRRKRGSLDGEKVRLSAPGYRSTTRATSDVFDDLLLLRGPAPASLTVLDLDGRPIVGARFKTRQTCAHEPPALDVVSDAQGRFDLSQLPPLADEPEGEIDAPGYEALRLLQPAELLELGNWSPEQFLGRKRALRVRVLEHDGAPAAKRRVLLGAAPEWQAAITDDQGRVTFDSLFAEPRVRLQVEVDGVLEPLVECCAWRDAQLVVRRNGAARAREAQEDDAVLAVTLEPTHAPWLIVHEQGWIIDTVGEVHVPPGRCTLYTGADFSGWRESATEFVLAPREHKALALDFAREPRLTLPADVDGEGSLVIECNGHSRRWPLGGDAAITVPAQVQATLVAQRSRSAARLELPPIHGDKLLEWSQFSACSAPQTWSIARLPVSIEPPLDLTARLAGTLRTAGIDDASARQESKDGVAFRWRPTRPSNEPWELALRAEGCIPRMFAGAWNDEPRIDAHLLAFAKLELRGNVSRAFGPHGEVEREEDGVATLEELAPGPLTVRVQRHDGTWIALALELSPGETRALEVR